MALRPIFRRAFGARNSDQVCPDLLQSLYRSTTSIFTKREGLLSRGFSHSAIAEDGNSWDPASFPNSNSCLTLQSHLSISTLACYAALLKSLSFSWPKVFVLTFCTKRLFKVPSLQSLNALLADTIRLLCKQIHIQKLNSSSPCLWLGHLWLKGITWL